MLTSEEMQQRRSPSELRKFVEEVWNRVGNDKAEWELGVQKKGCYKQFLDEIVPLSRFAEKMYPETYRIQPVLGNQGHDARVFDEMEREIDKIEIAIPKEGAENAEDARHLIDRGYGVFRVGDPGDAFKRLGLLALRTSENKARKDYSDCILVIAISIGKINPFPEYEAALQELIGKLQKIKFKAKGVFLLVLPDRVEEISANV